MVAPYFLILAHARSGSNHLQDVLRGLEGVASLGELFNRGAKTQLADFVDEALESYGSRAALAAAAITDPLATLAFREKIDGVDMFIVKVLGQQLRNDRARRILIDNAIGVVVLRRNPFSAWVSRALVEQSSTWVNSETNRFEVTYDEALFLTIARRYSNQIQKFRRILTESRKPFVSMTYSDVVTLGTPANLWKFLRTAMPSLPELRPNHAWKPQVFRQDERLPIDRIGNPSEAIASLERLGLGYLVENTDTDDLDYLISVLAKKPQRSALRRFVSATARRLGRLAKK